MRLTHQQIDIIRLSAQESFGANVQVFLFGSRLDDNKLGGDIDIMLELTEAVVNPALLSAQFSAKLTRLLQGRKVDVLLAAPNLIHLPIHEIAFQQGQKL
ncbi:nucleotidyltransferase domain-containing protein [Methylomonas paludis]|uniref:Nucleotidyltransferase domain-containing protein n=1 Tax=Methylomonas paludis TaxID=1173101 RepID=A0A975MSA1_9GAMM|nr:nucleotidyltransferase domain-containing protein [Methylomonas paludis]QWF72626.1 nucleotidyltransferase domain-containing protein [Methylomonas paludis]